MSSESIATLKLKLIRYSPLIKEFSLFVFKLAKSCLFAASFFVLLFISTKINIPYLPRYDFLFISAIILQVLLLLTKLETIDELKAISMFHVIGLMLEIFKTNPEIGSWSYPEFAYFKIFNVPLYSGFMYAAVASFMIQSWRHLNLELKNYPKYRYSVPLAIAVYLNFFTHHYIIDLRWLLSILILIVFFKTRVKFTAYQKRRQMPLIMSFLLMGFFIWVAENIATYFQAWKYPNQAETWHMVHIAKISSWALLIIMSFIIIADLKHYKEKLQREA